MLGSAFAFSSAEWLHVYPVLLTSPFPQGPELEAEGGWVGRSRPASGGYPVLSHQASPYIRSCEAFKKVARKVHVA